MKKKEKRKLVIDQKNLENKMIEALCPLAIDDSILNSIQR